MLLRQLAGSRIRAGIRGRDDPLLLEGREVGRVLPRLEHHSFPAAGSATLMHDLAAKRGSILADQMDGDPRHFQGPAGDFRDPRQ
jgi:hypothetical protein